MPSNQWEQYAAPAPSGNKWDQYAQDSAPEKLSGPVGAAPVPAGLQGRETYPEYLKSISTPQSAIDMAKGVGKGVLGTLAASNPLMTKGFGSGGDIVNTDASNQAEKAGKILEGGAEMVIPGAAGADALPSATRAAGVLGEVADAAKNVRVPLKNAIAPLQRVTELGERGGVLPTSANALLKRTQMLGDMTFPEARDYYSNISGLSADEAGKLNGVMKRSVGDLRQGFHGDLTSAANTVGMGDQYAAAMKEYAQAMKLRKLGETALTKVLPAGGALGAIGYAANKLREHF